MKPYHKDLFLGEITDIDIDMSWRNGNLHLTPEAEAYRYFFSFMTDESNSLEEPPFTQEMLENWFIKDEQGEMRSIDGPPAVLEENTIEWRWG